MYRAADDAAWENNPLILGYEIRLSETTKKGHSYCSKCVSLAGKYPSNFKWTGWHDGCICFKIPILMDDDMMAKYQKLVAQGLDTPGAIQELQKEVRIKEVPKNYLDLYLNEL